MFSLDIAGIAISVFFIFFISKKRNYKKADLYLILINLNIIGLLATDALFQQRLTHIIFYLLNILPLYLLPLFLIYALEIMQEKVHHKGRWVLFFLPALLATLYIGFNLFAFNNYSQLQLEALYDSPTIGYHILCKGSLFLFILAFTWLIKKLNIYSISIKERYSFIEPIELKWLNNSAWIYLFITTLSLIGFICSNFKLLPITSHFVCTLIGTFFFCAVFFVSFNGIYQYTNTDYYGTKSSLYPIDETASVKIQVVAEKEKYKTSSLTYSEKQVIFQQLIRLFERENLYKEPKLQLNDVAEALQVSPHSLSQTINSTTGKPFYDFVNSYRVQHLQKLLLDPSYRKFTILSMGLDSGFNSKATMNRVFRQETGLSPSEYWEYHHPK